MKTTIQLPVNHTTSITATATATPTPTAAATITPATATAPVRVAQHLTAFRAWCKQCLPVRCKPDVLCPGTERMRESMAIRLRQRMAWVHLPPPPEPPPPPPTTPKQYNRITPNNTSSSSTCKAPTTAGYCTTVDLLHYSSTDQAASLIAPGL